MAHVAYHNPGPSSTPSDTNTPKDTPIYYANIDGSNATRPFGKLLASGITTPVFSPDGRYLVATGSVYTQVPYTAPQLALATIGGSYKLINGQFMAWRGDSQAMVLEAGDGSIVLYSLASGTTRKIEAGSFLYLWGH